MKLYIYLVFFVVVCTHVTLFYVYSILGSCLVSALELPGMSLCPAIIIVVIPVQLFAKQKGSRMPGNLCISYKPAGKHISIAAVTSLQELSVHMV